MRATALVVGLLLLVAGGLITAGLLSWPDKKEVLRLGDASLSVTQDRKPDPRLGYGLLGLGAVVLVAGLASRGRRR
jgi:hypothetical protein